MIKYLLIFIMVSFPDLFADIFVIPASGGTDLSVTSPNVSSGWAALGDITITEGKKGDISKGQSGAALILSAPFNWQFFPGEGSISAVGDVDDISSPTINVTITEITIRFSTTDQGKSGTNETDIITISGIKVKPVNPAIVPSLGVIRRTGGNAVLKGGKAADNLNYGDLSLDQSNPLPVELYSFTASVQNKSIHLKWQTITEINNYGFEVERALSATASDGSSAVSGRWVKIGFVRGSGSSNSPKEYLFIDKTVNLNEKYFYRLKQLDSDGLFTYSKIIEAETDGPSAFVLSQNYPNPFNPRTKISFLFDEDGKAELKVFNPLGREAAELFNGAVEAGRVYELIFNAANLPSGIYLYRLTGNGKTETRKMLVIK